MPKIDNIEETPNPNAVKFILKEPVTAGTTRSFHAAEEAAADPLGGALFAVGDVASVFYMDKMVTVEKTEEADWDDLLPRLAVPIRAAESVATNGGAKAAAAAVGGALGALVSDDPRVATVVNKSNSVRARAVLYPAAAIVRQPFDKNPGTGRGRKRTRPRIRGRKNGSTHTPALLHTLPVGARADHDAN